MPTKTATPTDRTSSVCIPVLWVSSFGAPLKGKKTDRQTDRQTDRDRETEREREEEEEIVFAIL